MWSRRSWRRWLRSGGRTSRGPRSNPTGVGSAVVGGAEPALAAGAVEHRPLPRRLADHRHPDRRAAPPARAARAGVDVVRLAQPAVAGARLHRVVRALSRRRVGPGDDRSRSGSASSAAGVQGPIRSRNSVSAPTSCRPRRGCAGRAGRTRSGPRRPQVGHAPRQVPVGAEDVGAEVADEVTLRAGRHELRACRGAARARVHVGGADGGAQVVRRRHRGVPPAPRSATGPPSSGASAG